MPSASSPVQRLRQRVLALMDPSDPFPFLSVVEDYLAAVPADDVLRAEAVRLLVTKGLVSVAVELARACPASSPEAAGFRRAAEELSRTPVDRIDPGEAESRFARNLDACRSRDASLAEALERIWREGGRRLTLHQASDGNRFVRAEYPGGRWRWVPALLDFAGKIEIVQDAASLKNQVLPPLLVDGVGMGWMVPRLRAATERVFLTYSPAIDVVEPNTLGLAAVLHLHDWAELLTDIRIHFFVGPSAWDAWRAFIAADPALTLPQKVIAMPAWPDEPATRLQETVRAARQERDRWYAHFASKAADYSAGFAPADWGRRFQNAGRDDPLRVLCVSCRFTTFLKHSTEDAMAAMERAGCKTRLLIEPNDHTLLTREAYMAAAADFRPDLIFIIDHHRQEFPERYPAQVPYVCWIQDELPALFDPEVGRKLGPLDFTMGFGRTRCVLRFNYPADRFMSCHMAVDWDKFSPEPDGGDSPALRCDAVYVSHHSETPEALHERIRKVAGHEILVRVMDAFFEETRSRLAGPDFNAGHDLDRMLRDVEAKCGLQISDATTRERVMAVYVRPLADRILRHASLEWVADWADGAGRELHIYGQGWEGHPRFSRYARGPADHGRQLAAISRQAIISLHSGMSIALHQRVLETVAAGGFIMLRYNPNDFHDPAMETLRRYLSARGIRRPTRIPMEQMPADYVAFRRQRAAATGRPEPREVIIDEAYLLEQDPYREGDRREDFASLAFPDLGRITFDSPRCFAEQAEYFIAHPDERREIVDRMRASVRELFTYDGLIKRLIAFLRDRLVGKRCGGSSGRVSED